MPYGQGQMLGAGVDPRMFVQDYSGFTRAAEIQAQGMQNLGTAIGNVAGQVGDYFKQQGEKKKLIKQSDVQIDAALKLFPDLAPTLQNVRDQIKDENISINDRAAIAESVAGLIQMGTNQMRFQSEQGWKQKEYELSRQAFDVTRTKAQSEIESKAAEERQANSIATAEALGSLNALKKVESDTGNKFIPDDISTAVNDLVSSGQGKAAAALINKYSDRLDPAIKAEFATKKAQTPVNIALPEGGTQQMVPNAKGEYEPVRIAGFGTELEAGVLPTETPLTATRADAEPLTINDVPRGAEKTNEVTVGGETYEVYVDKNSPLEPYDIFGVTLPNFENAPKEQWTNQGKYLVRKQTTTEPAKTVGPGTVGYTPSKQEKPTKVEEAIKQLTTARELIKSGKEEEALAIVQALQLNAPLFGGTASMDTLYDFFGQQKQDQIIKPELPKSIEVNGTTYNRPANFTDSEWESYINSVKK
jgi:hypothetical protein